MKTLYLNFIVLVIITFTLQLNGQSNDCENRIVDFKFNEEQVEIVTPPTAPPPPSNPPGDGTKRTIYWLHGMGGDYGSWASANAYTILNWSPYVKTDLMDYSKAQQSSVEVAAAVAFSQIDKGLTNDPEEAKKLEQNYIIAHSMGGIVGRKMDQLFDNDGSTIKPYGGLVTFGSPHTGSKLADIKVNQPEVIENFIKQTCVSLLSGPSEALIKKYRVTRLIDRFAFWTDLSDWLTKLACEKSSKLLFQFADASFSAPIEANVVPGSSFLKSISNHPPADSKLHSVAFYGEEFDENEDMAIRFLFSATQNAQSYPLMEADVMDDEALLEAAKMRNLYYSTSTRWRDRARNSPFGDFFNGKFLWQADMYDISNAYQKGVVWFDNLNNRWKYLMGGLDMIPTGKIYCFCDCKEYNPNGPAFELLYEVDCADDCSIYQDNYTTCTSYSEPEMVGFSSSSDGLVTSASAIALPNAKYWPVKMDGSGHFQMRNDSELKKSLDMLFESDKVGTDYFKLTK